jgi:hypothetical protein
MNDDQIFSVDASIGAILDGASEGAIWIGRKSDSVHLNDNHGRSVIENGDDEEEDTSQGIEDRSRFIRGGNGGVVKADEDVV